jgi:hypothetical protein
MPVSDGQTGYGGKYRGMVYVPVTNKLFSAPYRHTAVLVVDPSTNTTGYIGQFTAANPKFAGIVYVPTVGKLLLAPDHFRSVAIVDPATNETDVTALVLISQLTGELWQSYNVFAFSNATGMVYGVSAAGLLNVGLGNLLIVDPVTNSTNKNLTTTTDIRNVTDQWGSAAFSPIVNKIFAPPVGTRRAFLVVGATVPTEFLWTSNTTCSAGPWTSLGSGWVHNNVASIPQRIGGCDVYGNPAVPTDTRFSLSITTVRFPGPGFTDPATPARFANWTLDLPQCITLDLTGN